MKISQKCFESVEFFVTSNKVLSFPDASKPYLRILQFDNDSEDDSNCKKNGGDGRTPSIVIKDDKNIIVYNYCIQVHYHISIKDIHKKSVQSLIGNQTWLRKNSYDFLKFPRIS